MRHRSLRGATREGAGRAAVLTTGLRVDKPRGRAITTKGRVIDVDRASNEIIRLRAQQVGKIAASATLAKCEGRWLGGAGEPTLVCQIEHIPSPREQRSGTFERHMLALAERVAERFGQKEVWVKIGDDLYRSNAPSERGPRPLRPGGKVIR